MALLSNCLYDSESQLVISTALLSLLASVTQFASFVEALYSIS